MAIVVIDQVEKVDNEASQSELVLVYSGDVGALCQSLAKIISRKHPLSSWIRIVFEGAPTKDQGSTSHLKAFRKLVRICPYAVLCTVDSPRVSAIDFVVAMTCDGVRWKHDSVEVVGDRPDLRMATRHFKVFAGVDPPAGKAWPVAKLAMLTEAVFGPWAESFPTMLPYMWMGLRHAGLAMLKGLSEVRGGEPTPEQLRSMEDCYSSCKVSALFAVFDSVSDHSVMAVGYSDEAVDAAAAAAIEIDEVSTDTASVTLTSDIIYASVPQILQKLAAVQQNSAIKTVKARLVDGTVATSRSIFPRGVSKHGDIFKWHRKWEQVVHFLAGRELVCTVEGMDLCLPLLELFFAAKVRVWASPAKTVTWGSAPFWYSPGPEAMKGGLKQLPVGLLRQLLMEGLPLSVMSEWKVLQDFSPKDDDVSPCRELGFSKARTLPHLGSKPRDRLASSAASCSSGGGWAGMGRARSHTAAAHVQVGRDGLTQMQDAEEEEHLDDVEVGHCITRSDISLSSIPDELDPEDTAQRECGWEYGGGMLRLPKQMQRPLAKRGSCSLIGYGLATPGEEHKWTQERVADMLRIPETSSHRSLFKASHIQTRYLAELERDLEDPAKVTLARLREKHLHWARVMLSKAIKSACEDAKIEPSELRHISVCSTSGYLLPGLTAFVAQDPELNISPEIGRQDIVGMGCHAGLNSLKSAAGWACNNPGKYAVACGVEVMSAQYVWGAASKTKLNNVICNSLFGDGCFAAVFYTAPPEEQSPPKAYLDMPPQWWTQYVDTGALDDMIYHVEESEGKYRFDLSELAPYHVSQGLLAMMRSALGLSIPVHCADHVVMHTGGRTVLNCSMAGLGLEGDPQKKVPWTVDSLRDFGNQSSSSFIFALDKLVRSGACSVNDAGLFVTMGPGAGLEMAMWTAGERFGYPYDS